MPRRPNEGVPFDCPTCRIQPGWNLGKVMARRQHHIERMKVRTDRTLRLLACL